MAQDSIEITILEDGTIKVETDAVSAPNHSNAEQFLAYMARLAGGETTRTRKPQSHTHVHTHVHTGGSK